jgi:two-component system, NarL family, nitrate/nitrite response regulator NarL
MMAIRLVLSDDHPIVLNGLQQLFERQPDFSVLQCCCTGQEAIEAVRAHRPDVLVLDMRMPGLSGLDVLRALSQDKQHGRTVILTAAVRDEEAEEALRLGATGIVLKESSPETLLECVRRVHQGMQWIDHETLTGAFGRILRRESAATAIAATLTAREIEVVRRVADGLRNKEIADKLSITDGTVKIHLHNIYEKLGVNGRLELVLYAQQKGLV